MTYTPVIPTAGLGGFTYLQRTREKQQAAMEASPLIQRNIAAFQEKIATVKSAEELVGNRQLLTVALSAFGLSDDLNSKYLIRKILEADPSDPKSLVSRYADKRYRALSEAFGFGSVPGGNTATEGFADKIAARYADREFEVAAGEVDQDMRLGLAFGRDLNEIANREGLSDNAKWFNIMATPSLRTVFETALNLPSSIGNLDLDRQLEDFRDRAERVFGTSDVAELSTPEMQDKIVRDFLVRSQLKAVMAASYSPATAALALLRPGG